VVVTIVPFRGQVEQVAGVELEDSRVDVLKGRMVHDSKEEVVDKRGEILLPQMLSVNDRGLSGKEGKR